MMRIALAFGLLLCLAPGLLAQDPPAHSVGMMGELREVVLPGSRLEVIPVGLEGKVVVRITDVRPHGTAFRYSFSWYGLEPGEHDLKRFLRRSDGSPADDLPAIPIRVLSVLPEERDKPSDPEASGDLGLGGYELALWIGGVLWVIGLVVILFVGRKSKAPVDRDGGPAGPTLETRLRPLVERALIRTLDRKGQAELELLLIEFWRGRLDLGDRPQKEVLAILKHHEEAGPLIRRLEEWLHRPEDREEEVDLPSLLSPYRGIPDPAVGARLS